MRRTLVAGTTLSVVAVFGVSLPAVAAGPVEAAGLSVSGVQVNRTSSSTARVTLRMTCPRHSTYSMTLELLQDATPDAAPLDAYYTGTRALEGRCSGRREKVRFTAVADTSGAFAPTSGRLRRGPVDVVVGATVDDEFDVVSSTAKVRWP